MGLFQYNSSFYSSDSLDAIELKLVKSEDDINDAQFGFHPDMTYQIFGEKEKIVGFNGLKVRLYYTAGNLTTFLDMSYKEKAEPTQPGDLKPVDVLKVIADKLQRGYLTSMPDFVKALQKEGDFKPVGTLVDQFTSMNDEELSNYEVYDANVKDNPEFKDYNERLQTFLMWYIEAASFVDADDDKWRYFVLYEKYGENSSRYAVVGFVTVYEFFCYPSNIRPRISQMLILPPFQSRGLGAKLLSVVYKHYRGMDSVTDITVESPSLEFQRLRDYVDCKIVGKLPSFSEENLKKGFTKEMAAEAHSKLKMSKKQALRVCNILRLQQCDGDDEEEMGRYIRSLEKQVDKPHQVMVARAKRRKLFEKLSMKQVLDAMPSLNEDYRRSLLQKATDEMMEQFRLVIARLDQED